jgi:hypothetical protein
MPRQLFIAEGIMAFDSGGEGDRRQSPAFLPNSGLDLFFPNYSAFQDRRGVELDNVRWISSHGTELAVGVTSGSRFYAPYARLVRIELRTQERMLCCLRRVDGGLTSAGRPTITTCRGDFENSSCVFAPKD